MERKYGEAFAALNSRQRQAVETIDGPVLVIAGPGTGKTQLISTRVGHILQKTDTPADAILLLTFTEAGVQAMRDRLDLLIGRAAYDVNLSTYHAFGAEIFRRYPDYFEGAQLSLLEDLNADSLLRGIIAKLPYSDPLKFADSYINELKSFISDAKRALLTPEDIERAAADNLKFITHMNKMTTAMSDRFAVVGKKAVPAFKDTLKELSDYRSTEVMAAIKPLASYAKIELTEAIDDFHKTTKTTSLTEWKRRWLAKDTKGRTIFDGRRANERLLSAAQIYRRYQRQLRQQRLYDYDDMIIRAIEALETNADLRYSLADRYSYIMLDEFQDTNPAQFRLVQLLTDHPVHEGRPNVLAVGDDNQAIYAFQGADHANMTSFVSHYKAVKTITLTDNYRAWPDLIEVSENLSSQIGDRLVNRLDIAKKLSSAAQNLPGPPSIVARQFKTDAAQYNWLAQEIKRLVTTGLSASHIAVLAPKHRFLAPLLPYLAQQDLPVKYERRENILDEPLIHQLEQMSRLVLAIAGGDVRHSNHLWPEVLSYDFWRVPTETIWRINWQSRQSREPWTSILLNEESLKDTAAFFIKLSTLIEIVPLEQQLDALIGLPEATKDLRLPFKSPLYEYYFSDLAATGSAIEFTKLISELSILRERLQQWRQNTQEILGLRALVEFIDGHRAAGISVLNTSPYFDQADAINLLTAYGAKGREFQAVFVIAANDEVWGSASRNQGNRISLPANLSYIRYQGASEDERLRLLYVAVTRARSRLYFTGYDESLAGSKNTYLKYLGIGQDKEQLVANILPKKFNRVIVDEIESIGLSSVSNYWSQKHLPPFKPQLIDILTPRLKAYKISASDLKRFIDLVNHGPSDFFMSCILRFPAAPTIGDSFGTAVHNTLRFAARILQQEGKLPTEPRIIEIFNAQLQRDELPLDELENLLLRGTACLQTWLEQRGPDLKPGDFYEYDFQNEKSRVGDVALSGKIDRIIIDEKRRVIHVLDYKTGRAYGRWQPGIVKLHLFRQQLMIYKLLIENSARFREYKVEKGIIEFVEPDENGQITRLELDYDNDSMERTIKLIKAVWKSVQSLKFPDISSYPLTFTGIKQFEDDLLK